MMDTTPLKIKFLGTGGAFEVHLGHSSAIVEHNGARFLIDCGGVIFSRLVALDLVKELDGVIITHLHDDHVGSLSSLVLYYQIVLQKGRLKIYTPTTEFEALLNGFLSYSLGQVAERVDFRSLDTLSGTGFVDTYGRHVPDMPTFAYYFTNGESSIVYSGDNGDPDFLFQELEKLELPRATVFHEVLFYDRIRAHAHFEDLMPWAKKYPIYLYHCNPAYKPAECTLPLVQECPELHY